MKIDVWERNANKIRLRQNRLEYFIILELLQKVCVYYWECILQFTYMSTGVQVVCQGWVVVCLHYCQLVLPPPAEPEIKENRTPEP